MISSITSLAASEHVADLRRAAEQGHAIASVRQPNIAEAAVSLRIADADDGHLVRDLAALDDAPVPSGEVLLALINGEAVAALSLHDGGLVANPFVHSEPAIALLRLRANQASRWRVRRRWP